MVFNIGMMEKLKMRKRKKIQIKSRDREELRHKYNSFSAIGKSQMLIVLSLV